MKKINIIIAVISLIASHSCLYAEIGLKHAIVGNGLNVNKEFTKTLDSDLNFDSCLYILDDVDLYYPRIDDLRYSLELERSA